MEEAITLINSKSKRGTSNLAELKRQKLEFRNTKTGRLSGAEYQRAGSYRSKRKQEVDQFSIYLLYG